MLESIKKPDGINIPEIKIVFRVPANYNAQEIQKNPDNILKEIRIFRKEKGIGKKVDMELKKFIFKTKRFKKIKGIEYVKHLHK